MPLYLDAKLSADIKCKINNDRIILELFDVLCDFTEECSALDIVKKAINYKYVHNIEMDKISDYEVDLLIKVVDNLSREENPHYDSLLRFIYEFTDIVEEVYTDEK